MESSHTEPRIDSKLNRRAFLRGSSALAATAAMTAGSLHGFAPEAAPRKNAIWLIADQWRAQSLGCNGDPNSHTPNLDRLATSGVNFDQARSTMPLCCPFRGSMLTGRYPHQVVPGHEFQMPPAQRTIAHELNDAGYHTAYFGKWHLDGFHESEGRAAFHVVPPERRGGFQYWLGYENNNSQWDSWVHGGGGEHDTKPFRLPGFETDALSDIFINYLREPARKEKPFFAVLSVQPPHNPYIAPASYMQRYNAQQITLRPNVPAVKSVEERARQELAGYYAQIENWDTNVGRIVDALTAAGMLEDTHIMIFADHGDLHGSHGQFLKMNPYEESVRIPMIVSGERSFYGRGSGRAGSLFSAVDIAPTTLGLCGLTAPKTMLGHDYSSRRLRPGRVAAASEPDSVYLQSVVPTMHADSVNQAFRGLVTADGWKYVCFEKQPWMLFNLNEDPYELVNMALNERYKAERKRLEQRLKQWVADTGDTFEVPTA